MSPKRVAVFLVALSILAYSCGNTEGPSPTPADTVWVEPSPYPTVTPEPTILDNTLYGIPCKPPCWNGLIPGQSTREETIQVLVQLVANGQAHHIKENGENLVVFPTGLTASGRVDLVVKAGVLHTIHSEIVFDYSLGDLVTVVGPPEFVYPYKGGADSGVQCDPCAGWTPGSYDEYYVPVYLVYPTQGLLYGMRVPNNGFGCLCPQMRVRYYCYYPPTTIQDMLGRLEEISRGSGEALDVTDLCVIRLSGAEENGLGEWHGFGKGY